MDSLIQDVRYGVRMLRKKTGFTSVAVLTLMLGIGANTAIFQLLNAVALRSLPVDKPWELASVQPAAMNGLKGLYLGSHPGFTYPLWERFRDRQQLFSGVLAFSPTSFDLSVGGEARYCEALWVNGEFFNVLGVRPALGRLFTANDDSTGCGAPVAVISHRFWQREYGGDPKVAGKTVVLDGNKFEIVGVTTREFFGVEVGRSFDVAVPLCAEAMVNGEAAYRGRRDAWWLTVMGRLNPGSSIEDASASLASISKGLLEETVPGGYTVENLETYLALRFEAMAAGSGFSDVRDSYEQSLWLMLALAGLVLLIACANLANLLLARASSREREVAIRLAIGASRLRLVRQWMVESLLLSGIGAAFGLLLAMFLSNFLVSMLSGVGSSLVLDLDLDWRVLLFTTGLATLTCVLFGLAPAFRGTGAAPASVLKASSRGLTASRERFGLRRVLVVAQVALSLTLLIGALLFARSLYNLVTLNAGFKQEGVLIAVVDFSRLNLSPAQRHPYKQDLLERIRSMPGVDSAACATVVPVSGSSWTMSLWMQGGDPSQKIRTKFNYVSPDYFRTMGIEMRGGRDFEHGDSATSTPVAIVNEAFAMRFLDGENPVGRTFVTEAEPNYPQTACEVVGLVKNTKYDDLREEFKPIAYVPDLQHPRPRVTAQLLIRSSQPLASLRSGVTRRIGEASPEIGINYVEFKSVIREGLLREQLTATLSGFFGLLALMLACTGLYGVISYNVASRTNEIGIRMALGAQRGQVFWLILRETLILVLIGIGVGLPGVLAIRNWIAGELYDLSAIDPTSMLFAAFLMAAVAAAAGYVPAFQAARLDPMTALRDE